jgi:hypothetical protein
MLNPFRDRISVLIIQAENQKYSSTILNPIDRSEGFRRLMAC